MDWFPDEPALPPDQQASAESTLRYEDVAQDGRVLLLGMPHTLGDAIWRSLQMRRPVAKAGHEGVIPILTRFVIEGGRGPVSVRGPLSSRGGWQVFHTVDDAGEVNRLFLNMWLTLSAPVGHTHHPPPAGAGQPTVVGRVFAEHVFTRLFAPPEARKVVRLGVEGFPEVPPGRWTFRPPATVLEIPGGARWLDEALVPDPADVVFGLHHTDSNQHVNSLVYPRLFQDAALRRFAALGRPTTHYATRLEIAYRKPCFAGEKANILLRAFESPEAGRQGVVGVYVSERAPVSSPHCTIQMTFTP